MIGKTNAVSFSGGNIDNKYEDVIINFSSTQGNMDAIIGVKINVKYGGKDYSFTFNGEPISFKVPDSEQYTISFGSVSGYDSPKNVTYIAVGGNRRNVNAVFTKLGVKYEEVTVNVSAKDGSISELDGAVITATYGSNKQEITFIGSPIVFKIPEKNEYIISFGNIEGYGSPSPQTFTSVADNKRKVNGEYIKKSEGFETVTVNITSDQTDTEEIKGVKINVKYGQKNDEYSYNGLPIIFKIPQSTEYTVSFGGIAGYIPPKEEKHTAISNNQRSIDAKYVKEVKTSVNIYIIRTNGLKYLKENWNPLFNTDVDGVLLEGEGFKPFIISPTALKQNDWGYQGQLINNIPTNTDYSEAVKDFNGEENTQEIIGQSDNYSNAAEECSKYTFPSGENGYLGSLGEWELLSKNASEINECLAVSGCDPLPSGERLWTSTQYSSTHAWTLKWDAVDDKNDSWYGKVNKYYVRPFCRYIG